MQKLIFLLAVFISSIQHGFSQDSTAIHYAIQITPENTRLFLEVLTSDSLEGRETGKPGQKKAAQFIAQQFQALGLKPVSNGEYFQHTSLSARANEGKNFQVNQKKFLFMLDYFYPAGFDDSLYVLDTIAFVGYGISEAKYDDYKKVTAKNRAVIFFDGEPRNRKGKFLLGENEISLPQKLINAKNSGATLAIVITDSLEKIIEKESYGNIQMANSPIPFAYVTKEMANFFFPEKRKSFFDKAERKILRKGKPQSFVSALPAHLSFVKNTDCIRGENVVGFIEGTDKKEEVLVLTAHYDHLGIRDSLIYHGADDDGSGTVAVMEMAKIFSRATKEGNRPRRSILFMTVSGEEKGLLGSKYYVKHPLVPLDKTIADLNTDMVGRTDEKHDSLLVRDYVYIIGSDKLSRTLHQINEKANTCFTKLELDYTFNQPDDANRFYYRSDHYNFAKKNIPIIFYFNGTHADYHKPTDTIDKIQFDLLTKRTQLVFLTAWELANREERIAVDVKSDMPNKKED